MDDSPRLLVLEAALRAAMGMRKAMKDLGEPIEVLLVPRKAVAYFDRRIEEIKNESR